MRKAPHNRDAFGQALYDCYGGKTGYALVIERDDGLVDADSLATAYLSEYKDWPVQQRKAIRLARGKVLDVGCGAGRHSLHLQQKGLDALGIDASPLAIEVCKLRGLRSAKVMSIDRIGPGLGTFDTIIMLGNNFGLLGGLERGRVLLRRFHRMTGRAARIIAETLDPYRTDDPCHLAYHKLNRARGRLAGQLRIRARYKDLATAWFDYLFVSKQEMRFMLDGTGWKAVRFIESGGPVYVTVIEKDRRARREDAPALPGGIR